MHNFSGKLLIYRLETAAKYLFLILMSVTALYPFIWVVLSSLKDNNEIYGNSFGLPHIVQWGNYLEAWKGANVGQSFLNSFFVCMVTVLFLSLISSMGSYVLTRLINSRLLSTYFLLGLMIPIHALLIPSVLIFKGIHLQDSLINLIILYTAVNISFSMFIMNGFLKGIPKELDEAATIDGSGKGRLFFQILLPIAKPGIATVATLTFLNSWNDLLLGLVMISTPSKRTLSIAISVLKGAYMTRYGLLCAGFVISIAPVVIMYLLFQKQVIAGMTAGAVKG